MQEQLKNQLECLRSKSQLRKISHKSVPCPQERLLTRVLLDPAFYSGLGAPVELDDHCTMSASLSSVSNDGIWVFFFLFLALIIFYFQNKSCGFTSVKYDTCESTLNQRSLLMKHYLTGVGIDSVAFLCTLGKSQT